MSDSPSFELRESVREEGEGSFDVDAFWRRRVARDEVGRRMKRTRSELRVGRFGSSRGLRFERVEVDAVRGRTRRR